MYATVRFRTVFWKMGLESSNLENSVWNELTWYDLVGFKKKFVQIG